MLKTDSGDQNVLNFTQNQNNVKLQAEIAALTSQATQQTEKFQGLKKRFEELRGELEMHKIQEEHCRKKIVNGFEQFCAAVGQVKVRSDEDLGSSVYDTVLLRSTKRK